MSVVWCPSSSCTSRISLRRCLAGTTTRGACPGCANKSMPSASRRSLLRRGQSSSCCCRGHSAVDPSASSVVSMTERGVGSLLAACPPLELFFSASSSLSPSSSAAREVAVLVSSSNTISVSRASKSTFCPLDEAFRASSSRFSSQICMRLNRLRSESRRAAAASSTSAGDVVSTGEIGRLVPPRGAAGGARAAAAGAAAVARPRVL